MYQWYLAVLVAGIGHAFWDSSFRWLVNNDPETSLFHMHWLRMCFITLILAVIGYRSTPVEPKQSAGWWAMFSLTGFVIPPLFYTLCSALTGYRIIISVQTFVPIVIFAVERRLPSIAHCRSLIIAMIGTASLWWDAPWLDESSTELWMVWFSCIAAFGHVWSLAIWFSMLGKLQSGQLKAISVAATAGLAAVFFMFVAWTPQHLAAASLGQLNMWLIVLVGCAISAACKYWVIAVASKNFQGDAVAILECIHPISTLLVDLIHQRDHMETEDILAIACIATGWILYPTKRI